MHRLLPYRRGGLPMSSDSQDLTYIRPKFLWVLLKACPDNSVQVITTGFFINPWNEVPLFLKHHPMVWILEAESFLMQSIVLSDLTLDFKGYPRELVFHGRTFLNIRTFLQVQFLRGTSYLLQQSFKELKQGSSLQNRTWTSLSRQNLLFCSQKSCVEA